MACDLQSILSNSQQLAALTPDELMRVMVYLQCQIGSISLDATTLSNDADNFNFLEGKRLMASMAYDLAVRAGLQSTSPDSLLSSSSPLAPIPPSRLRDIYKQLDCAIASSSGGGGGEGSCDLQSALNNSHAFDALTPDELIRVMVYLQCQIGSIALDAATLSRNAANFNFLEGKTLLASSAYNLAVRAGLESTSADSLLASSSPLASIPPSRLRDIYKRLDCEIAGSGGGGGTGTPNVTAGLVNWWKFDENSGITAKDSAGSANGSAGAFVFPSWVPGIINSALSFNGDGDATTTLQLATNTSAGNGAFTVSAWVYPTSDNGAIVYDSTYGDGGVYSGFWFQRLAEKLYLNIVGDSADCYRVSQPVAIPTGSWTFILGTWDGTLTNAASIHLYANAVETSYSESVPGSGPHIANTGTTRLIGGSTTGPGTGGGVFPGIIDDVRIYNRVLSASEITQLFGWRGRP